MSYVNVDLIRDAFSEPIPGWRQALDARVRGDQGLSYCVGGALYLWMSGQVLPGAPRSACFPSPARLAACLRACNPRLGLVRSLGWAFAITVANDHGVRRPAGAWAALERALAGNDCILVQRQWVARGGDLRAEEA